jgi:hypothetical protein
MKKYFIFCLLILTISCRYTHDASDTAFKEFKPSELLKKYEYYKDCSASLDKKIADIQVYDVRVKSLQDEYKGIKRQNWAKEDREQLSIWMSEVAGIKASYNTLAAEYNSAMSKFNYAFCNVGDLPKGAINPLPKEYKPYITQ